MAAKIKVPKARKGDDTNYTFDVGREHLNLSNGNPMGVDGLYRMDTGEPLSVVSPKYVFTPHTKAVSFVEGLLDSQGLPFEVGNTAVAFRGNRFFREYRLPSMKFVPGDGNGDSTALDGGKKDEYFPTLIVRNSYDRSSTLDFLFGGFRLVCTNGLILGDITQRVSIKHVLKPDFEKLGQGFITQFERNIEGFKRTYARLNTEAVDPYLELLLLETFTPKMTKMAELLAGGLITLDVDNDGNVMGVSASKNLTAYALYQLATEISTRSARKYHRALQMHKRIAKVFGV